MPKHIWYVAIVVNYDDLFETMLLPATKKFQHPKDSVLNIGFKTRQQAIAFYLKHQLMDTYMCLWDKILLARKVKHQPTY